jgi:hypothetical protein
VPGGPSHVDPLCRPRDKREVGFSALLGRLVPESSARVRFWFWHRQSVWNLAYPVFLGPVPEDAVISRRIKVGGRDCSFLAMPKRACSICAAASTSLAQSVRVRYRPADASKAIRAFPSQVVGEDPEV